MNLILNIIRNNTLKNVPTILCILSFLFTIIIYLEKNFNEGLKGWVTTEWLINFQGGFVRRGLPGEIIYQLSKYFSISPNYLYLLIASLSIFIMTIYLIKKTKGILDIYYIFSPFLIGMAIFGGFAFRKDIFIITLLAIGLTIFCSSISKIRKFFFFNFISIIAILSHEAYFFFSMPGIILFSIKNDDKIRTLLSKLLFIFPSGIAFFLTIIFRGNRDISIAIYNSWDFFWNSLNAVSYVASKPTNAIDAISWSVLGAFTLSHDIFIKFKYGIHIPFLWLLFIIILSLVIIKSVKNHNQKDLIEILIIQFISISPLFIIGCDYGRWIFYWILSSILFYINDFKLFISIINIPNIVFEKNSILKLFDQKYISWIYLFIGMPSSGLSLKKIITHSPIYYIFDFINSFIYKYLI